MGRILKKLEEILKKLELFLGKGPWKIKLGRALLNEYTKFRNLQGLYIDYQEGLGVGE